MTLEEVAAILLIPMRLKVAFFAALLISTTGCRFWRTEIWIYTSLPKETISPMVEPLKTAFPSADIHWFQGKSESVAARLVEDEEKDEPKADLVLTGDPFWFIEAKKKGKLLPYQSQATAAVPAFLRDSDHAFTAARVGIMVLAYHAHLYKPEEAPQRWKDLEDPKWKGKASMGSPFETPASFLTVALLSRLYGWEHFTQLRKQNFFAEGSGQSVIRRIEIQERPVGIALLETVLRAQQEKLPVNAIYPADGVIAVPSPIGILKNSKHPELAKKIYDWFFSTPAQTILVQSGSYSPLPEFIFPDKAKPWPQIQGQILNVSPEVLSEILSSRDQIKAKFSDIVLH